MRYSPAVYVLLGIALLIGLHSMLSSVFSAVDVVLKTVPEAKSQDPLATVAKPLQDVYNFAMSALKDPFTVALLVVLGAVSMAAVEAVRRS